MTAKIIAPQATRRDVLRAMLAVGAVAPLVGRHPAFAQTATPLAGEATTEHLFQVTLPKSTFPLDAYYAGIVLSSLPPGFKGTLTITDQVAQNILVLDGAITIEKGGAARVFRNGGKEEAVAPDDTLTLQAGDDRLIFDLSRPQLISNRGTIPAHFILRADRVPDGVLGYLGRPARRRSAHHPVRL